MTELRFSWPTEKNQFLRWLMPTVLAGLPREEFERITELTDRWSDVRLTIAVNGVQVDAGRFVESVKMNMDRGVADEAAKILLERTSIEAFDKAVLTARRALVDQLTAAGLELCEDDFDELCRG